MAQEGPTIHTKITHEERRDEKGTLNDVIIGNNYVKDFNDIINITDIINIIGKNYVKDFNDIINIMHH